MSAVWFMFEGQVERLGLKRLLDPVFSARSLKVEWSDRYQGREDLINKLPKLLRTANRSPVPTGVVALVDYLPRSVSCSSPTEYKRRIVNRVDMNLRQLVKVHLANPDIEAWIVAERVQLAREPAVREEDIRLPRSDQPAVDYMRQLFKNAGRQYRKTKEGEQLLGHLDRRLRASRCLEARDFLEDIARICGMETDTVL